MVFESAFLHELLGRPLPVKAGKIALWSKQYKLSYECLRANILETAAWLRQAGLRKGSVVAIMRELDPAHYITALLAVIEAGAIPSVIADTRLLHENNILHYTLSATRIKDAVLTVFHACHERMGWHFTEHMPDHSSLGNDCLMLMSSSGTTAQPKIIIQTQRGILANIRSNCEALPICLDDVSLSVLPVNYSYGLTAQVLSHLYCGATVVFEDLNLFVLNISKKLEEKAITNIFMVPSILRQVVLFARQHTAPSAMLHSNALRFITVGGGHIDRHTFREAARLFACQLIRTYGLTEAGPRVSTKAFVQDEELALGNVGLPLATAAVHIVDEQRKGLPEGETGTVLVSSPSVCLGYINSPSDNIVPSQKIYTRDAGYMLNGELHVLGRDGDYLYAGGRKIWFAEIQEILYGTFSFYRVEMEKHDGRVTMFLHPAPRCSIDAYDARRILEEGLGLSFEEDMLKVVFLSTVTSRSFK